MKIRSVHRNFLIINQVIVSTIFNFFLNMGIAWILYRNMGQVPIWGGLSIGVDTLVTAFILPWATCYTITLSIRFAISREMLPPIEDFPKTGIISAIIKKPIIVQGIIHGMAGLLFLGLPVVFWFMANKTLSLPFCTFLIFKATFAAFLSIAVAPVIGLFALFGDVSRRK